MSSNSRRGFTLVEILAVCAIILVLAGILFPVLGFARERARTTTCQSNSFQLASAMLMYEADANGAVARGYWTGDYVQRYWIDQLAVYGLTEQNVRCPDFPPTPENGRLGTGWAVNVCLKNEASIAKPARTVLFTETTIGSETRPGQPTGHVWPTYLSAPDIFLYSNPDPKFPEHFDMRLPYGATRHFGRSNYSFNDGHVADVAPGGIRLPYNRSCQSGPDVWTGPPDGPIFRTQASLGG